MSEIERNHILGLIESQPLADMSETDLATVRAHSDICSSCKRAFEAAQISALLLKEGSPETFEPPPFFQTRVLAALRERQTASEPWAWSRIWKATGALASSMIATVAALAVLTFVIPGTQTNTGSVQLTSANSAYSEEEAILNEGELNANQLDIQTSDGQVLNALYETDGDTGK
jgi:hypothetical protein